MPNILVVESDASIRDLLDDVLSDEGYQVRLLELRELSPCQVAAVGRPDLMLLEITPFGAARTLSLVEQLRHQSPTGQFPVLVCATDPLLLEQLRVELRRLGCATLLKPFDVEGLLQLIRDHLASAGGSSTATASGNS